MWITSPEPVLTPGGPMRVTPSNGTKKRGTPVIGQHRWKRCCAWISIVTLGMFAQFGTSGMAETTTQFVYADDEASARGVVQFLQDGFMVVMVAEVSPDGFGGWSHWGTEALAKNKACEALLLCTRDANLQLLSSSGQWGYWRCVAKLLLCEAYSLACIGTAATCIQAWDCWQEASWQGCTP